jgi:hypothetical protein
MEKVIWKYQVKPRFDLDLPEDALVLSVQVQGEEAQMWVLLDPEAPKVKRTFDAIPTGRRFDASHMHYIGTFQMDWMVFHLFEVTL